MQRVEPLKFADPTVPGVEHPRAKRFLREIATQEDCDHFGLFSEAEWLQRLARDARSNTEMANQEFDDRVRRLPGVWKVEIRGGQAMSEKSCFVYLAKRNIEAEYGVYDLKGELLDRYPGAHIDVLVLQQSPEGEFASAAQTPAEQK